MSAKQVLVTGSGNWTDRQIASDALNAAIALLGWPTPASVLVQVAPGGADQLLSEEAQKLGMNTVVPPGQAAQLGDLCLAFPTDGYAAPGQPRADASLGTWNGAEWASKAGIPTLVVWGPDLFPFGDAGRELLHSDAERKKVSIGAHGQVSIIDSWLPF
jgi:hypothetical protein